MNIKAFCECCVSRMQVAKGERVCLEAFFSLERVIVLLLFYQLVAFIVSCLVSKLLNQQCFEHRQI